MSRLPKLGRRTSLFLTAPNHAVILEDCPAPRAFNSVHMAALAFAEHYELYPDLLVALDAEATRTGDLRRDVVLNLLRNAAEALPPIAAPAAKRAWQRSLRHAQPLPHPLHLTEHSMAESSLPESENRGGRRLHVFSIKTGPNGSVWVRAGTAWYNRDGSINIYLDVLPLDGKLHLREPAE